MVAAQHTMTRFAYSTETSVILIDADRSLLGRGAYVCSELCLEKAIQQQKLQRNLKAPQGTHIQVV